MNTDETGRERAAAELDGLVRVPDEVLAELVAERGLCLWAITEGDPPAGDGTQAPDQALAAALCAGCPVRRECLEVELRTAGAATVGVWGGLNEDDRRALHVVWQARRTHAGTGDEQSGGQDDERR